MIVHREQRVKRDKTNKMQQSDVYYQLLSQHVSGIIMPIFRRTNTCVTAYGVLRWFCWMWLVAVVGRCNAATNHIQQNQRSTQYAVTHGLCSPEDGHNDARNMLRQKLIINISLFTSFNQFN